jgi:retron-type reverse transcriptase
MVLEPIYEAEFLGFSYGFRPNRSQHKALDALYVALGGKTNWVLDVDIRSFFDTIDHGWLRKFIEHRIAYSAQPGQWFRRDLGGCSGASGRVIGA